MVWIIDWHFSVLMEVLTLADTCKLDDMMLQYGCAKIVGASMLQNQYKFMCNSCETYAEFVENSYGIHNGGWQMQMMHWCTEWWCICREAEKSVGTNLSHFLLFQSLKYFQKIFWCQSRNLKYFRTYSGTKSLVQLLRSNWGIRNAWCCARHDEGSGIKVDEISSIRCPTQSHKFDPKKRINRNKFTT